MNELQVTINSLKDIVTTGNRLLFRLEKAQKDLETPPIHEWKHGDIYKSDTGCIMVYLKFTSGDTKTVCIHGPTGGMVQKVHFNSVLQDAKFLFNIEEKL